MKSAAKQVDRYTSLASILLFIFIAFIWFNSMDNFNRLAEINIYAILCVLSTVLYYFNIITEVDMAMSIAQLYNKNLYEMELKGYSKYFYRNRSLLFTSLMMGTVILHLVYIIRSKNTIFTFSTIGVIVEITLINFIVIRYVQCMTKYNKYMKEWFK